MKELSNGQLQDDFLQSLWLQRMPPHIQTVLSASSEPLDELAIIADKVSEVVGSSSTICAATTVPPPSQSSSCSAQPTMDSLARQIQELSLQVAKLTRERNSSRHQLNSVTEFDSYPMPYLNDFAHALHGKKIFSKIDIFKAFHQIPIAECDIPKTAVTTPWGLYEYTHLCFGLVNAPQTFMRFMHEVLRGLPFCFVYLDDILCYSENAEEHRSHLRTIFQRLSSYGLLNFYRRFLPKAAEQQYLLSEFLKGSKGKKDSKPLNWSSEAITAFQRCKQALADAALFAHPSPSAPLALHVDASDYAIGGALHQLWTLSYSHWLSFPENLLHLKSLTVPT
ncbi:hypothetical protein TNCV_4448871 [Trichonephila clavipes]|nr:hypothetical protein TNCV_4448871 [Trichonephila clavipes]